jgi:adenylate kinase family enzyme
MARIVVIGNSGGGKSTLTRSLAARANLCHVEVDSLLWQEGWKLTPEDVYERQHTEIIGGDSWILDGLGRKESIPNRLERATQIILIDMPLWMHFWLAAERQISWTSGNLKHTPGGISQMPPTEALFKNIWEVEKNWMPEIRSLCTIAQTRGTSVVRITSVTELSEVQSGE